jgi:hypothetical protein
LPGCLLCVERGKGQCWQCCGHQAVDINVVKAVTVHAVIRLASAPVTSHTTGSSTPAHIFSFIMAGTFGGHCWQERLQHTLCLLRIITLPPSPNSVLKCIKLMSVIRSIPPVLSTSISSCRCFPSFLLSECCECLSLCYALIVPGQAVPFCRAAPSLGARPAHQPPTEQHQAHQRTT